MTKSVLITAAASITLTAIVVTVVRDRPLASAPQAPEDATLATSARKPESGELLARFREARQLAKAKDYKAATEAYIWCFENGRHDAGFNGIRRSYVPSELLQIGRNYPKARAALESLRAATETEAENPHVNHGAIRDLTALNQTLGEEGKTLAFHDRLPPADPRRPALAIALQENFVQLRRYKDAATGFSVKAALAQLDQETAAPLTTKDLDAPRLARRERLLRNTARHIEVLIGIGELPQARELADRMLALDPDATPALLQVHVQRAGLADISSLKPAK